MGTSILHRRSETPPADHDITPDELLANPQWGRCELVDGKVYQMSPAGHTHGEVAANLLAVIWTYVQRKKLGRVYASETGFIYPNKRTVRAPDVMFISTARIPADLSKKGFLPVVPDFAVEVVSPEDPLKRLKEKAESYLSVGVILVWVVDPFTQRAFVYEAGRAVQQIESTGTLDGGTVLRGFSLNLSEIFAR